MSRTLQLFRVGNTPPIHVHKVGSLRPLYLPRYLPLLFQQQKQQQQQQLITSTSTRSFTSSIPKMSSPTEAFIETAKSRRTYYKLGKNSPVSDADKKVEELVTSAILNVPSAFNTQSTRLIVLLHKEHEHLWDIVIDAMYTSLIKPGKVPEETWKNQTLPKLKGLQGGYGTVGFFFFFFSR